MVLERGRVDDENLRFAAVALDALVEALAGLLADAADLAVTIARPGEAARTVALVPDPLASDPTVPLEQSFSADIEVGPAAGELVLTVSVPGRDGPRTVTRTVPVLAP